VEGHGSPSWHWEPGFPVFNSPSGLPVLRYEPFGGPPEAEVRPEASKGVNGVMASLAKRAQVRIWFPAHLLVAEVMQLDIVSQATVSAPPRVSTPVRGAPLGPYGRSDVCRVLQCLLPPESSLFGR
jgi:hypothetical protein